jgi:hypothetical protein
MVRADSFQPRPAQSRERMETEEMANFIVPRGQRSPTAVRGYGDLRQDWVYSAIILGHGGAGSASIFTVPKGQAIPTLEGAGIAPTDPSQLVYSDLTTNITQAGQLGNAIGDISVKRIGATVQLANVEPVGTLGAYGATTQETPEILSKISFEFKVSSKTQAKGPLHSFPGFGGVYGSVGVAEYDQGSATVTVRGFLTNGMPDSQGRKLLLPIQVGRLDQLEGIVLVGGPGTTLTFSVTTGIGQSTTVWFMLDSIIRGDVR